MASATTKLQAELPKDLIHFVEPTIRDANYSNITREKFPRYSRRLLRLGTGSTRRTQGSLDCLNNEAEFLLFPRNMGTYSPCTRFTFHTVSGQPLHEARTRSRRGGHQSESADPELFRDRRPTVEACHHFPLHPLGVMCTSTFAPSTCSRPHSTPSANKAWCPTCFCTTKQTFHHKRKVRGEIHWETQRKVQSLKQLQVFPRTHFLHVFSRFCCYIEKMSWNLMFGDHPSPSDHQRTTYPNYLTS